MPNYLDLFAGIGGLSEGFVRAGYTQVAHIEMDKAACNTLKTRSSYKWLNDHEKSEMYMRYFKNKIYREKLNSYVPNILLNTVLNNEIFTKVDKLLKGQMLDLIVGGSHCQACSLVGMARDKNGIVGDLRNYLHKLYAEFLKKYNPKYFVFENVLGLLLAKDTDGELYFGKMRSLFKNCGYSVEYKKISAKDCGVLQNRSRIILIGKHGCHKSFYSAIPQAKYEVTVGGIFKDLPKIKSGERAFGLVQTLHHDGTYLYAARIKEYDLEPVILRCSRPKTKQDLTIYGNVIQLWNKKIERLNYTDLPAKLRSQKNLKSFLDHFKVVAVDLPIRKQLSPI